MAAVGITDGDESAAACHEVVAGGVRCHASASVQFTLVLWSAIPNLILCSTFLSGQRHVASMTTTKGLFDRFVDRLDFLVMGDRSKARTSDAVLNIVTAAGFVSLPITCAHLHPQSADTVNRL